VADEQLEVCLTPKYSGEPVKSSLLYDSDFARAKVTTDIILNGSAYVPHGKAKSEVVVTLRVGELTKSLIVKGDRYWMAGLIGITLGAPAAFTKMPIIYERAFGGAVRSPSEPNEYAWDPRNPIGTGFASKRTDLLGQRAHNVFSTGHGASSGERNREPAGFGAIPSHWSPRVKMAGTCDAKWQAERSPLLPYDLDDRFYQCAPTDQQYPQFLKGGERVELTNLTRDGHLAFDLPRVILGFQTDFGGTRINHRANLHTVILEPDFPRVVMVWHTALPCHQNVLKLRKTRIFEKTLLSRQSVQTRRLAI